MMAGKHRSTKGVIATPTGDPSSLAQCQWGDDPRCCAAMQCSEHFPGKHKRPVRIPVQTIR